MQLVFVVGNVYLYWGRLMSFEVESKKNVGCLRDYKFVIGVSGLIY